ncbi:porin [Rhodoferax sp. TS-BS-61-7]|uniref:porin n=1 Tax=Rhodoferax sp. TS-BS-61-7 TaxID=2094194 RepID=UPI000CF69FDE|nr:porin [Rhodoferax sp. TS-BS-61-7]PQA75942.1 hypothetical protein C5F53_17920 [Rhodoferax sp. TS-BS-61-7]
MNLSFNVIAALTFSVCASSVQAETPLGEYITFSGFGTLGYVQTDSNEGQFKREQQARGATTSGTALVDSNLGLQLTARANDKLSFTVQTVTQQRTEEELTTKLDWAFVKLAPLEGLAIRAGRFNLPNFLVSDSRKVGYANIWLRPPNEVYGVDVLNGGLDGADLSYRLPVAGNSLTITGLLGSSSINRPRNFAGITEVKNVQGINLLWDGDWYTVRLGQVQGYAQLSGDILNLMPAGQTEELYEFTGLGFSVDRANVVLQAEMVQRRGKYLNSVFAADGSYLMAGYRFGKFLPYMMLAEVKPAASDDAPQDSIAVGLRWDAFSSAALKFQLERTDTKGTTGQSFITPGDVQQQTPLTKSVNVLSVSLDFVF